MKSKKSNESGQTVLIMLFVMVVALAIGVAVSNRFIATLRFSTEAYLAYRAAAVAEAAIENILILSNEELSNYIDSGTCESVCYLEILNADGVLETATVSLSYLGDGSDSYTLPLIEDTTDEVGLEGYGAGLPLSICWDSDGYVFDTPSIYATLVYGTTGTILAQSYAYNSSYTTYTNGFEIAEGANGFDSCILIAAIPSNPRLLRLRSIYQDVDVTIIPHDGGVLPSQGIRIISEGRVGNIRRSVSVVKRDSIVPAIFDYALFSTSTTQPLSN